MPRTRKLHLSTYQRPKGKVGGKNVSSPKDKSKSGVYVSRHDRDYFRAAGACEKFAAYFSFLHLAETPLPFDRSTVRVVELCLTPNDRGLLAQAHDVLCSRLRRQVVDQALRQRGARLWVAVCTGSKHTVSLPPTRRPPDRSPCHRPLTPHMARPRLTYGQTAQCRHRQTASYGQAAHH